MVVRLPAGYEPLGGPLARKQCCCPGDQERDFGRARAHQSTLRLSQRLHKQSAVMTLAKLPLCRGRVAACV